MKKRKEINRRDFLKVLGTSTTSTALLYGCTSNNNSISSKTSVQGEVPTDKMTYRTSLSGDKVSLLGYGCMRWPLKASPDGNGEIIDQDAVNELVDYASSIGMPRIGYISVMEDNGFKGPIDKFLTDEERSNLIKKADLKKNSVLFFIANK